jgi:protein SCO1/2
MNRGLLPVLALGWLLACDRPASDPPASASAATASSASAPAASEPPAAGPASLDVPAKRYFGDLLLVDQDGRKVNLYDDLIHGKVVVINVFFSTCKGSCPVMAGTYARLQEIMGERLGKEAYLISISVDPENDTPERLKEFGRRYNARPGWYFLTGEKQNVDAALKKLGQAVKEPSQHSAILLVGNDRTGLWKKVMGLADPAEVAKAVMSVLDDRGESGSAP